MYTNFNNLWFQHVSLRKVYLEAKLVVLFGPSGVGKSTLLKRLLAEFPSQFGFSVSHTTRSPRLGEVHGREYNFVNRDQFEYMVESMEMFEHAEYSGNYYGTSIKAIQDVVSVNKTCLLDIDMQGVQILKSKEDLMPAMYIAIQPPSFQELEDRLRKRNTETEESLMHRLDKAKLELSFCTTPGIANACIINEDLDLCYDKLKDLLQIK